MAQKYLEVVTSKELREELVRRGDESSSSDDSYVLNATYVMVVIKNVRRYYTYRALSFKIDEKERKLKKYMKRRPKAKVISEIEYDGEVADLWTRWVGLCEEHVDRKGTRFNLLVASDECMMLETMVDERWSFC